MKTYQLEVLFDALQHWEKCAHHSSEHDPNTYGHGYDSGWHDALEWVWEEYKKEVRANAGL